MRHIVIDDLRPQLPADWEARAAAALAQVARAAPADRSEVINRYRDLWRELAFGLASLSYRKCWYCESRENRSDKAVDHFRPKGRVAESPAHPGYWWLAFDWTNYRYSCTYFNSRRRNRADGTVGGKQDHFPLLDEAGRAFDAAAVNGESPALLDPACRLDTLLLYFREDGYADARTSESTQRIHFRRAQMSIDLYHLNHEDAVEARVDLYRTVKRLVETGRLYFDAWDAGNPAAKAGLDYVIERLHELMRETAEFSAAARDMIRGFRDDRHSWIDGMF